MSSCMNLISCRFCIVIVRLTPATFQTAKAVNVLRTTMVVNGMTNTITVSR